MTMDSSAAPNLANGKRLLAVPTSAAHKQSVAALIEIFRHRFDVWLFVWDDSFFDEPEFASCRIVQRDGYNKWDFVREFMSPADVQAYEFLFVWDDDLDVSQFAPESFLGIVIENNLQMAQPALSRDSYISHRITQQQPGIGRFTDFVEVMAPVWTRVAWPKWHAMLTPENPWGWGYDLAARSACGYQRMGIVDCTPVRHTKPFTRLPEQFADRRRFFAAHPEYQPCQGREFGPLVSAESVAAFDT
jgi:hypothetical protein